MNEQERQEMTYYHGGVKNLNVGDFILPPSETGVKSCSDISNKKLVKASKHRKDRVYLTTDIEAALAFASLAPCGNLYSGGDVYEVKPIGAIERDPDYIPDDDGSITAERAEIIAVIRRSVRRCNLSRLI